MGLKHNILHRDGTQKMYQSPAIAGQYLYFTSRGDDIENNIIGKGNTFLITNEDGASEKYIDVEFLETIQLKDAYIFWEGAVFGDKISAEVILPAGMSIIQNENKGNAAEIDGTIQNITDSTTPDETWTGTHLLFPIDISIIKFANDIYLLGDNTRGLLLESQGVAEVQRGLRIRLTYTSADSINTNIKLYSLIEVYRERTI